MSDLDRHYVKAALAGMLIKGVKDVSVLHEKYGLTFEEAQETAALVIQEIMKGEITEIRENKAVERVEALRKRFNLKPDDIEKMAWQVLVSAISDGSDIPMEIIGHVVHYFLDDALTEVAMAKAEGKFDFSGGYTTAVLDPEQKLNGGVLWALSRGDEQPDLLTDAPADDPLRKLLVDTGVIPALTEA